jgi:hypothetical protein
MARESTPSPPGWIETEMFVDYFRSRRSNQPGDQPVGDDAGWGLSGDPDKLWTFEELAAIKKEINAHGLELEAIENFDPAQMNCSAPWHCGMAYALGWMKTALQSLER